MQSKLKTIVVLGILFLGFVLRWHNYDTVPVPGDSLDEYSFSWVGFSLLKLGMPVGAIGVGGYDKNIYRYVNVDRIFQSGIYASPLKINYPWFDHPPLLGLVTGGYANISGAQVFEDLSLHVIRRPMLVIGVLAVGLVMLLGYEYFGFWPAVISGLIYATSPLIVISSRMVQAENLLIIWFLLILLMLKKEKWLWVGIFTSLAMSTKFSAVAILPVTIFQISNIKNKKEILKNYILGLLPGLILLGIYFGIYGFATFLAVNSANTNREYAIGTAAIFDLITKTRITHIKLLTDGWILASWLAFFGYVMSIKKINLLSVYIVSYLATYILFGNFPHGWYATPFWPVLFIFLGKIIVEGEGLILSLIPLGIGVANLIDVQIWRWSIFGILITNIFVKNIKFIRIVSFVLFGLAILTNAVWVYRLNVTMWYKI